jgi:hypothetical protein
LLYLLSDLTTKPKYRQAVDAGLRWFFQNATLPDAGVPPWGEHRSWDVMTDKPTGGIGPGYGTDGGKFFRAWLLWDRCFELAPEGSRNFALSLQPANDSTKSLDRDAGICIRTWAAAYAHTRDEQFLKRMETLLERLEGKRGLAAAVGEGSYALSNAWPAAALSLAIDCNGASHSVPGSLASRLRAFAASQDEAFCALKHDLKQSAGFVTREGASTGRAAGSSTPLWTTGSGSHTTAQVGLMCVSRYDNGGGKQHRDLLLAAADAYLDSMPPERADLWPGTFGHAISLQIAAWRHSARPVYLERARTFGDLAIEKFWATNALPRASLNSEHYEAITGADTLALALAELHLHVLHITAVRCPPNTLDR